MSSKTRYLFGYTKADTIKVQHFLVLEGLSVAPEPEGGLIYRDASTGKLKLCADSTNYETITSA